MTMNISSPAESHKTHKRVGRPWALNTPPPLPTVAVRVISILGDDGPSAMKQVIDCIETDPAFAAEVLRTANSALLGIRYPVTTIPNAVMMIGLDLVKALALTVGMRSYLRSSLNIPALRSCWTHSLVTALLCRELGTACGVSRDEMYTAGLLHDIGRIGLMACYPVEYANVLNVSYENSFDVLQCERDLFDVDHCEAGAWLAEEWRLPRDIGTAAAHHHDDLVPQQITTTNLVGLACRLADALDFRVVGTRCTASLDEIRACLPGPAQARFQPDIETLKAYVAAQLTEVG